MRIVWILVFASFALWVANRLGAFHLWRDVSLADGSVVRFPATFATIDHPFHAARSETLRRALADGELLRWVGQHQGGYPVEFYPFGAAVVDILVWAASLGTIPMMAAHKLAVIAIFLLPVVGYLLIAGFDKRSLGVALVVGAAQVGVRGWWWSGGSMELIEWGLVTNVAAATALVICLPLAFRFVRTGSRWACGLAGMTAAFALVTNPRTGIALASLVVGIFIASTTGEAVRRVPQTLVAKRLGSVVALAALLAAPEIISLARFSDLYYFVHYTGYADLSAYWDSSVQATGGPFFVLGIAGFALAWLPGSGGATRAVAATLAAYVGGTVLLVTGIVPESVIGQLELTRLMPFQRYLWIFLAASAIEFALARAARLITPLWRWAAVDGALVVCAGIVLWLYIWSPPSFIPVDDRGMVAVATTAEEGIVDLEAAVKAADNAAEPGTAILVLGTRDLPDAWHDQLWAPMWSERPFFYDDWLWYWQQEHVGNYNPEVEHAYRTDASALEREYLDEHAIGAVVVTGDAVEAAARAGYLTSVRSGQWDVYTVDQPTSIVTFAGKNPESIDVGNQSITANGAGGEIEVRRNWFPRWEATVNGSRVEITHLADGYMSVSAPEPGPVVIEMHYRSDWIDWFARMLSLVGVGLAVVMFLPTRWIDLPRNRFAQLES